MNIGFGGKKICFTKNYLVITKDKEKITVAECLLLFLCLSFSTH